MTIGSVDLVLLIAYLLLTVLFGLWMGRGQRSAKDYLLGGRDLPWWALLISIVATETSTATFLSVPGIAYGGGLPGATGDLRYLQLPLGYLLGRSVAAFSLLPLYFKGELFTAYDVLRERSGARVRTIASGIFLLTRTLADGLRLYLAALVLNVMFGWPLSVAVPAMALITVVYTALGGIKAVVFTDVIQFAVYMAGALGALVVLDGSLDGGLWAAGSLALEQDRLRVFDFGLDFSSPYTFWAGLIGGAVLSLGSHGVDQIIVQRYLSARSQREARRALLWSGPVVLAQFLLFLLLGLLLSYYYAAHPPEQPFEKGDRVFADFIVRCLPVGMVGVVLGAVFSAAMSTLSSSLSASASALVHDFVLPALGRSADSPFALKAARWATLLFAALQSIVGVSGLGGTDAVVNLVLAIATLTTGVILGLFVLALRQAGPRASEIGLCVGLASALFVQFGLPFLEWKLAWPWHGLVTSASTVVGGLAARRILRA